MVKITKVSIAEYLRYKKSWLVLVRTKALFACLIIYIFQLIFSVETVFFSHNKSTNNTFSHGFSANCLLKAQVGFLLSTW
jgi:hypothetical protein